MSVISVNNDIDSFVRACVRLFVCVYMCVFITYNLK